jgi:hypothetical protein
MVKEARDDNRENDAEHLKPVSLHLTARGRSQLTSVPEMMTATIAGAPGVRGVHICDIGT